MFAFVVSKQGWPNHQETFSTQATEVKKLTIFFSFSYHNFEDTVSNFDKDMFRKESFSDTNSVIICFNYKTVFLLYFRSC